MSKFVIPNTTVRIRASEDELVKIARCIDSSELTGMLQDFASGELSAELTEECARKILGDEERKGD